MGHLYYGGTAEPVVIPDRLLAHLKVVIATKLRRNESFTLSWRDAHHRQTLWIQPAIALRFVFDSAELEILDREMLTTLVTQANSAHGLSVDLHSFEESALAS